MSDNKSLLLIQPSYTNGLWGVDLFKILPLSLMNLGSIVLERKPNWSVQVLDTNFERINFNASVDLVGISINTSLANRGYAIADTFRSKGIPVILGGIHATFCPEEAAKHADCIVTGEAEEIFINIIDDFEQNQMKSRYDGSLVSDLSIIPKQHLELFKGYNYTVPNIVQATRGCPLNCDFCSVAKYNGSRLRYRPIANVIADIKNITASGKKYFGRTGLFFADDNIFIDKEYAKELFRAITPLNIFWGSQSSIFLARDPEMLSAAHRSGCRALLIGFESVDQNSLKEIHKKYTVGEYEKVISNIHKAGIAVDASIIFGFQHEDMSVIDRTINFLIKNKIELAQFSILTPYPGSTLYAEMTKNNLINNYDWHYYDQFHMVWNHKRWSVEELNRALLKAYKKFYSYRSICSRVVDHYKRMGSKCGIVTAKMNLQYRRFNPN